MISPKTIEEYLNRFVVGQSRAKKTISNLMFLHACRINYYLDNKKSSKHIKINNLLVMGPSGSGKTFLIEKASEYLDIPVFRINAKSLSNTGYVGTSIEEYFADYQAEFKNHTFMNYGIIFIDEFDKVCMSNGRESDWYMQIQYSLLKYVEGYKMKYSNTKGKSADLDTSNLLFVFAGNFESIRKKRKEDSKPAIGFASKSIHNIDVPFQKQLIDSGVAREVMGRISSVVEIDMLTKSDYMKILESSEESVYISYQQLLTYLGDTRPKLTKKKLEQIAEECVKLNIGARGLTALIDKAYAKKINNLSLPFSPNEKFLDTNAPKTKQLTEDCPVLILRGIG